MNVTPEAFGFFRRDFGVTSARIYAAVFSAWAVLALLSTTETFVLFRLQGQHMPLWRALAQSGFGWLIYGALTPLILRLGDVLPVKGPRWRSRIALHLAFALVLGAGYAVTAAAAWRVFGLETNTVPGGFWATVLLWYLSGLPLMVLAYFGVHGLGRAVYWFYRNRHAELAAARLRQEATEARLAALQTQMHPHFLFNALNALDTLIHDGETQAAGHMLHQISDVLRESLDGERPPEVTLATELALVRKYLDIQSVRFADRLRVSVEIPKELQTAYVPSFTIQPLVENALRHGIAPHRSAGRLAIRAEKRGEMLALTVDDDGRGPPSPIPPGLGLGNLGSRLSVMYGDVASLELVGNAWGGASALVILPLHTEPVLG